MNQQKSAGSAFWFTIAILPFVSYTLMLGPACWLSSRWGGEKVVTTAYRPLTSVAVRANNRHFFTLIRSYSKLGAAWQWHWSVYFDGEGNETWRWQKAKPRA